MRRVVALAVPLACLAPADGSVAQTVTPLVAVSEVSAHVGETVTVCAEALATSCTQNIARDIFFSLTPATAGAGAIQVRIPAALRENFPARLDERIHGQRVCVTGEVSVHDSSYQVTASLPQAIRLPAAAPVALFAPEARNSCDAGVLPPVLLTSRHATYSADAMRRKVVGAVLVMAVVQSDGAVGETVVRRSLDPDVDAEVVKAVREWRFRPGTYRGQPAAVVVSIEMHFTLKK